jgi:hypothetical protein
VFLRKVGISLNYTMLHHKALLFIITDARTLNPTYQILKSSTFWDTRIVPYRSLKVNRCFRRPYRFHLQIWKNKPSKKQTLNRLILEPRRLRRRFCETLVCFQRTIKLYILEYKTHYNHLFEKLRSKVPHILQANFYKMVPDYHAVYISYLLPFSNMFRPSWYS